MEKIKKGVFLDEKNSVIYKDITTNKKRSLDFLYKEFLNFKKVQDFKTKSKIRFPKPIKFYRDKKKFSMEYIKGLNLKDITNPNVYFQFGKELKKIHNEGFSHSHLEIHDVIFKEPYFYLVDLPHIYERAIYTDYSRIILSIYLYMIKKPYKYFQYKRCLLAFKKGYNINNNLEEKFLKDELQNIINLYYKQRGFINKLRFLVLILLKRAIFKKNEKRRKIKKINRR